uniref:PDZ domain-containing protein n=1 Tax=Hemiselmis andersenii TaxID=464988 RepID=A0A6T8MVS0_HEMAN|mmetsp:Transcript_15171/g.34953  ORF Transcript_15171/g.34953 Transcript_15171/m.34953 type:complete len:238 (+) Transcript_15171:110-823(+)
MSTPADGILQWFERDLPQFFGVVRDDKTHTRRETKAPSVIPGWDKGKVDSNAVFGAKPDVGLVLGEEMQAGYATGFLIVEDFTEGGPAARSGMIGLGDRLLAVDGDGASGVSAFKMAQRLEGREGSHVQLSMMATGPGGRRYAVTLPRKYPFMAQRQHPKGKLAQPPQRMTVTQLNEQNDGKACSAPQQLALENVSAVTSQGVTLAAALKGVPIAPQRRREYLPVSGKELPCTVVFD